LWSCRSTIWTTRRVRSRLGEEGQVRHLGGREERRRRARAGRHAAEKIKAISDRTANGGAEITELVGTSA
jgi:hypothetical protein